MKTTLFVAESRTILRFTPNAKKVEDLNPKDFVIYLKLNTDELKGNELWTGLAEYTPNWPDFPEIYFAHAEVGKRDVGLKYLIEFPGAGVDVAYYIKLFHCAMELLTHQSDYVQKDEANWYVIEKLESDND